MSKPTIGFIGLGLMGSAMVTRLQSLGYSITVVANRSRPNVDKAVAAGATEVKTAREVAAASEIVMFCMDTSDSVESRVYGDDGVLAGVQENAVVIDFGTSLPGSTKKIGADVAEKSAHYMDAPLGRTPSHGLEGKLNIMAAGDKATFDRVTPILNDLGENVFHVGPLGAGHTLKLINNFYAMTTAMAMAEAFAMADLAGLPRQTLYDVMSAGPLKSGMMDFIRAQAIDGDIQLAFTVANARKDVGYYSKMADDLDVPSLMSFAAKNTLGLAKAQGYGDRMVPEMVDYFAELFKK
ncbi:MAG: 6-phosphogluconate dehydrogenase [Hyphomicrobiales bacterium]|nr:MAG: 6-phosphogluconate dehydrogenase [Hyphomicrobiales bacterium]